MENQTFQLNSTKCKLMMFTRKRVTIHPHIFLKKEKISYVTNFKFLGLFLDGPHLIWTHHIKYLKNECSRKLNILRSLCSKSWGASRKLLTTFYNSYIKSNFNYGIEAYSSASTTKLHKLEVLQNTAIKKNYI